MRTIDRPDERPTLPERYAVSQRTSDLSTPLDKPGGSDVLHAAGFAAAAERIGPRGATALLLWRMQTQGSRSELGTVTETLMVWLIRRGHELGRRDRKLRLHRPESRRIAETVLAWLLCASCRHCEGRRYELVPGTQVVGDSACHVCAGHGKPELEPLLGDYIEPGRWLVAQIDEMHAAVFADMARLLSNRMGL